MRSTRRKFMQLSAAAASALSLQPLAFSEARNPAVKAIEDKLIKARPLPLNKVRIVGGPLKVAQDVTAQYLLDLDPDRMMAYYRVRAGLPQKAQPYGSWDGGGRNLTGHIAGHHLSAVSLMYRTTRDARLTDRRDTTRAEI